MKRRPRGSGTIIQEGTGWAIRYGPRAHSVYEAGFRSKAEAERRLTLLRAEAMQRRLGIAADPRHTPTIGELAPPWLERRKLTHKAGPEDGYRWRKHLAPDFDHLRPSEVDADRIKAFAEKKLREGISGGTARVCVALLSAFYEDHRTYAPANPARGLPDRVMRLLKSAHDPKTTPFVERLDDLRRIFLALEEPLHIGFALGAFAGLRPGEAFAIRWPQIDLGRRRIHVIESLTGALKDKESRVVPILDTLHPVLEAWKLKSGGTGRLCPPLRCDGKKIDKGTRGKALRAAMASLGLSRPGFGLPSPELPIAKQDLWYWCTRHSFASHWVLGGGSIEKLSSILGHYSIEITWRHYVHLRPEMFSERDHAALPLDLAPAGSVAQISADSSRAASLTRRNKKGKAGAVL